jgi:RimK-like ATP-grasp domain
MIVVASHDEDDHATRVLEAFDRVGHPAQLVDTGAYPSAATLTLTYGPERRTVLGLNGLCLDLESVGAIWWRRPRPYTLDPSLAPETASFAYSESHEAMSGMWHGLSAAWVNPPHNDEAAHHKPLQLARAAEVGLPVPATMITNDPEAAHAFIEQLGPGHAVYKTFMATEEHWRETRVLRPEERDLLDSVRLAPVIFQEFVPAVADIRATVVGHEVLAAAITPAPNGYEVDYRMDLDGARFEATTLPEQLRTKLRSLLDRLGIVYGAIDLRLTPRGDYVFLEVNPAGEWLFVEDRTQQPITQAMADLLIQLDGTHHR